MRKRSFSIFLVAILLFFSSNCATIHTVQRDDYEVLCSAVTASSSAAIGEYGENIPSNFSAEKFMQLLEKKIPPRYLAELKKYPLEVRPKGSYYLLLVFDPHTKTLILFDYSCTSEPDGQVLFEPVKYDTNVLDLYDTCKDQK
jgi:hypothetical protein